jgi:glycerol-3-phosphate acyltransferase PlsX
VYEAEAAIVRRPLLAQAGRWDAAGDPRGSAPGGREGERSSMAKPILISLDAMGGDVGPTVVIPGAAIALERRPDLTFLLYGDEAQIRPLLAAHPRLAAAATLIHTDVVVRMEDKPSQALRAGRGRSSMWKAIEAVKTGEAAVAVSAGNTGALMAMSMFCLKTMFNVNRPAIAGIWPTIRGESIVLDIGATIGADAQQLVDFAVMGAAMATAVLHAPKPTVGLLNVGAEEVKGGEEVREAGRMLRETRVPLFSYAGFVEGNDIGKGTVDVVVTEGFAGNIALKTAEGTAKQITTLLRDAIGRTWITKLGYLLAKSAFTALRDKLDPSKVNGGVLLGLNGLVVKSHGGADAEGFAAAIEMAADLAGGHLLARMSEGLKTYHGAPGETADVAAAQAGEQ